MTDVPGNDTEWAKYAWAEKLFDNTYDVDPKYRDMLAMLAASMMGDSQAMEHFADRAVADGANQDELMRLANLNLAQELEKPELSPELKEMMQGLNPAKTDKTRKVRSAKKRTPAKKNAKRKKTR